MVGTPWHPLPTRHRVNQDYPKDENNLKNGRGNAMKSLRNVILFGLALLCLVATTSDGRAEGWTTTEAEKVGLSSERLGRISETLQAHVDEGRLAGAVALVARHGEVAYLESFGKASIAKGDSMAPDSIFRIYSMTKPVTTVGAMMLYEQALFRLNDPVSKYLPEFAGLEVYVAAKEEGGEATSEPLNRPITIRDLMRHTSGLTYGFFGDTPVDRSYLMAGILFRDEDLAQTVTKLGQRQLLYQPGTVWNYSVSTDVLGRLIEVISGMPLDEYFEKRIFQPLGMTDTSFFVPADKLDRLAAVYTTGEDGKVMPSASMMQQNFTEETNFFSGGGGLVSTATDYHKFSQMLLNGGELNGTRLLGSKTIKHMTSDHLGKIGPPAILGDGWTFGLGFGILKDPAVSGEVGSPGNYYWGGAASTLFWNDPVEDLTAILMIQMMPFDGQFGSQFQVLTYSAIID